MSDNEGRPPHHQPVQRRLHNLLAFGIEGRSRLVQDQNPRILENRPGNGDTLALSAGKVQPPLADLRVVALGKRHDKIVSVSVLRRLHNFFFRGVEAAVADILPHRRGKKHRLLRHDADLSPQRLHCHRAHVITVDSDCPRRDIVKARDQICDRRFSRPARSDEGDHLPR